MQNADVARMFDDYADILEIQSANPFRVRAYRNAARVLGDLTESVADIVLNPDRKLEGIPGIGKDLAVKIDVIVKTGQFPQLDEARAEVPAGVVDMLRIGGLGPKKVAALAKELSIRSLDDLRQAAQRGDIAKLKGFGKKTEEAILAGIEQASQSSKRFLLGEVKPEADTIVADLLALKSVTQATLAGSGRRLKETVADLDVLATAENSAEAMDCLAAHPLVERVLARGDTKQRVRLRSGVEMDLRVVPDESYGAAMQYFTGSKEHNIVIRRRAQDRGLKVNEYGVFRGDTLVAGRTEEEVYRTLDLPWIAPELRENRGEIERAAAGQLPHLLELTDLRGDLHMHTTVTDGTASILEMIEGAKARGLEYIAITDHSKRVSMANGLDASRLREHWKEIARIRSQVSGIEVLCGIECDILEDATLDLDDEVLAEADWVLAVLHYGLKQPRDQITKRLLTAITNPHVDCIGHPTGRLVARRPGADVAFDEILKAAADHGVMMEINAHPNRLDLDDVHAAAARDLGIPIVISTDSHSVTGLDLMQYGVFQARRAGLEKKDVANTRPLAEFKKLLARK
jgi:DNA polymerase (family 10)